MFDVPRLRAQTTALPHDISLTDLLVDSALVWIREGEGFVAAGAAARYHHDSPETRFALASQWFSEILNDAEIRDDVELPGSSLLAFGSFAFADSPVGSELIVPQVVVGRRGGKSWITFIGPVDQDVFETLSDSAKELVDRTLRPASVEYVAPRNPRFSSDSAGYQELVATGLELIAAGSLEKLVLARHVDIETDEAIDSRYIVSQLAERYSNCWTFAVDSLIGATPELLAATSGNSVSLEVLAGTVSPGGQFTAKEHAEHRLSVESAVAELEKIANVSVAETTVLQLPNVWHLATKISAELNFAASSLQVAGALHPTAALGGWPKLRALEAIATIEGDRERYGAPVGWMDATGGEWAIALRCAKVSGNRARAWVGAGIVAGSEPSAELAETEAKLAPIKYAFGL